MRFRGHGIAPLAIAVLLLAGCNAVPPSGGPSGGATPSAPAPEPIPLPEDALLLVTAKATAKNGAVMNLRLVVLKSRGWNEPLGVPRATATTDWCQGELDETAYEPGNYGFVEVDYRAELAGSEIAWPADLLARLLPSPSSTVAVTAVGGAYQIEPRDPNGGNDPGYYVPHCQQPAYLGGPASGIVYLALAGDTVANPPFSLWTQLHYGWTFDPINGSINQGEVTISDCTSKVTDLGKSFGATIDGGIAGTGTFCSLGVTG